MQKKKENVFCLTNVPISTFCYKHRASYPIYTSKQTFKKTVDLLLTSNSKNSHYVLIKKFDIFMITKTKHHGKKHFCWCFSECWSCSKVSECQTKKLPGNL